MENKDNIAIRKRTQIEKTNRIMLGTVIVASVVVGVSIVASIFLVQRIGFIQKVINEKQATQNVLQKNNSTIPKLQENVRKLNSDSALIDSKASANDNAVQVVLDALPSGANSLAVGGSLEKKIFANINDLGLVSLKVDPVAGVEFSSESSPVLQSGGLDKIKFTYSAKGNIDSLKALFLKFEKSIRVFDTDYVKIENQRNNLILTVEGHTYYQPAVEVKLTEKTIK